MVIFCICEVGSEPLNKEPDKIQHWQWAVWDSPEFDQMPLFAGLHNVRSAGAPHSRQPRADAEPSRQRFLLGLAFAHAHASAAAPPLCLRLPRAAGYHPFQRGGQALPILPPHGALSW